MILVNAGYGCSLGEAASTAEALAANARLQQIEPVLEADLRKVLEGCGDAVCAEDLAALGQAQKVLQLTLSRSGEMTVISGNLFDASGKIDQVINITNQLPIAVFK